MGRKTGGGKPDAIKRVETSANKLIGDFDTLDTSNGREINEINKRISGFFNLLNGLATDELSREDVAIVAKLDTKVRKKLSRSAKRLNLSIVVAADTKKQKPDESNNRFVPLAMLPMENRIKEGRTAQQPVPMMFMPIEIAEAKRDAMLKTVDDHLKKVEGWFTKAMDPAEKALADAQQSDIKKRIVSTQLKDIRERILKEIEVIYIVIRPSIDMIPRDALDGMLDKIWNGIVMPTNSYKVSLKKLTNERSNDLEEIKSAAAPMLDFTRTMAEDIRKAVSDEVELFGKRTPLASMGLKR
ncbi:MAG: hypothetical protein M1504_00020 [Candidatus Marsarchaeota archaeon]|nr:hypothetical protein [Candidatus Marsarchaeota archaeon]